MATSESSSSNDIYKKMAQRSFQFSSPKKRTQPSSDSEAAKAKRAARSPAIGLSQGHSTSAHVRQGTPYSSALSSPVHSPDRDRTTPSSSRDSTPTPEVQPPPDKPVRIPAFFIDAASTKNWRDLARELKRLDPGQTSLARGENYRVQASSVPGFRAIQRHLFNTGAKFHTFTFRGGRPLKVVIDGLPEEVDSEELVRLLQTENFEVDYAARLRTRRPGSRKWLVVFTADSAREEDGRPAAEIYRQRSLYDVEIKVAPYRRPAGPPQCHRCQGFGHGSSTCNRPTRCVRCGGNHRRQDCTGSEEEKKCCNCGGDHKASYRGCAAFQALKKKSTTAAKPRATAPERPRAPPPQPANQDQQQDSGEPMEEGAESGFEFPGRRRKRPPRNPANRQPARPQQRPQEQEEPSSNQPLAFRAMPPPTPRTRPPRQEPVTAEDTTAPEAESTASAPLNVEATLAMVMAQLTSLMALLTEVLAAIRKN